MIKTLKISISVIILCSAACSRNFYSYSMVDVHIPAGINIGEKEILARLAPLNIEKESGFTLRVTVYGYSQGAEIISLTGTDNFSTSKGRAWIKALVQVKRGDEIVQADFIEVSGNGRDELLDSFASRVLEITGGNR